MTNELKTLKDCVNNIQDFDEIKQEAIKQIKAIQNGSGIDRTKFPEDMKGSAIKDKWNDGFTTLAFEYGFIMGLMEFCNITNKELNSKEVK